MERERERKGPGEGKEEKGMRKESQPPHKESGYGVDS